MTIALDPTPAKRAHSRTGERGMALLLVLWIIVAAALLVSAFNAGARSGALFMSSEVRLAETEALLDAGTEIAAARLLDDDDARRWLADGSPHRVAFAGAALTIRISDANGLVDLNKADKELLLGLIRQFAGSEAAAQRLCDRILAAREQAAGEKPAAGGVQKVHEAKDEAAGSANGALAFIDVAQLRGIAGMTPALFGALAPYLTVYGNDGRIVPQAAPDAVLAAVPGLDRGDVERLRAATRERGQADAVIQAIAQRAGAFFADAAGPAYVVTVSIGSKGSASGNGRVSVIVPKLDADAPYRLIAKRPVGPLQRIRGARGAG